MLRCQCVLRAFLSARGSISVSSTGR